MPGLREIARRKLGEATGRLHGLPIVTLMPHGRCNCRCVMCDIWKANRSASELSEADLAAHIEPMRSLGVRWVVLSGGEALMHSNLWALCRMIKTLPAKITLLSTGLLLARNAEDVTRHCDEVILSLDGGPEIHDAIRRVPRAFAKLAEGVAGLRQIDPDFAVSARCVLQRLNFAGLADIIDTAKSIGLDSISFLAADVSTTAFNRPQGWPPERSGEVALTSREAMEFERILDSVLDSHAWAFDSGFVAESPDKLRRLVAYYKAVAGEADFPAISCNAPWVSAVIETDGRVRPCFFHEPYGSLQDKPFNEVVNSKEAINFRKNLDVSRDPICRRCVCTLKLG